MSHPIRKLARLVRNLSTIKHLKPTKNVSSSLKVPVGMTRRNSVPSGSSLVAWSECGQPGGKYQRSPAFYGMNQWAARVSAKYKTYNVGNIVLAIRVDGSHLGCALQNISPLRSTVPMKFSDGASFQTHINAGQVFSKWHCVDCKHRTIRMKGIARIIDQAYCSVDVPIRLSEVGWRSNS